MDSGISGRDKRTGHESSRSLLEPWGQDLLLSGYFLPESVLVMLSKTVSFTMQLFKDTHQHKNKKNLWVNAPVFLKWIPKR